MSIRRSLSVLIPSLILAALSVSALHRQLTASPVPPIAGLAEPQVAPAPLPVAQPAEAVRLPSIDAFQAVFDRPLFSSDRRPARAPSDGQAAPAAVPEASKSSLQAVLLGVVASRSRRFAVVSVPGQPRAVHLGEGEVLNGWKLRELSSNTAVLMREGDIITLRLAHGFGSSGIAVAADPAR